MDTVSNIYVCNLMGDLLYPLDEIDKSSVSLTELLNGQWELSFTYTKSKDTDSPAYEALEEGMYLYLEDKAHFKMRQPSIHIDAATESKEIHAYSCEVELEDKVVTFGINMGEKTSLEYLLNDGKMGLPYVWREDPDDDTSLAHDAVELLCNPYTTKLYDWIVLYNTYVAQLKQFLNWYRAQTLAADGSLTIMREADEETFKYCQLILEQITRLCSRAEDINPDHDGDGIEDVVTVEDLLDVNTVDYRFIQYVTEVKSDVPEGEESEVVGYVLGPVVDIDGKPIDGESFENRILMLIGFYETYGQQLSLLDIMCAQTNYTWVAGDVYGLNAPDIVFDAEHHTVTPGIYDHLYSKYEVANSRMQFDVDESIYSFWTSTYAQRTNRLVTFDRLTRRINITPVEFVGEDTGIAFDYDQLLNTLNISTNEDTLATRITVHGADDLSIEQVNFGEGYVVDLDYKMNARGADGKRLYVSDTLAEKYADYLDYRETQRELYRAKTAERNALNAEIHTIKYRLPADSFHEEWDTYTDQELYGALKEYSNKLNALQQMYGTDYGFHSQPRDASDTKLPPWVNLLRDTQYAVPEWRLLGQNETVIPRTEVIQRTMYWWDYVAYCQTLTQINIAMQARHMPDVANQYSQITIDSKNADVREMYKRITAWETEWSLYGTIELANKIATYDNDLQVMIDNDSVEVKHCAWSDLATKPYETVTPAAGSNPHADGLLESIGDEYAITGDTLPQEGKTYYSSLQTCFVQQQGMTADAMYNAACEIIEKKKYWAELTEDDQIYFADQAAYSALLDADIISKDAIPWTDLTETQKKRHGNIETGYYYDEYVKIYNDRQAAQDYLDAVTETQLKPKEDALQAVQSEREEIAHNARMDTCGQFSDYELKVLNLLMRDSEYTNQYILTTSLNDTVNALDKMEELYQDAVDKVRLFSRPQLIFAADVDNLLALPEFAAWQEHFELGNYIYVEYRDGTYTRVRMVGCTYNPCMVGGDLTVQFSNLTYTKNEVSDVESVLGMAQPTTSSGGGSSSGGSGSGATFEDLLARISQSMLERLLSPEGFVKEVSDVVSSKVVKNKLTSREQIWRSLANGLAEIDGGCLKTGTIVSSGTVTHPGIVDDEGNLIQFPVSWLKLDDGEFSFGDGSLMFYFGRDENGNIARDENGEPVSYLFVKGQVNADAGDIGGVQIGDPYVDPSSPDADDLVAQYADKLFIGRRGFFFMDVDDNTGYINNNFSAGISAGDYGEVQIQAWRYVDNPSRNMIDDMTAHLSSTLDHNGLHIGGATWNASTGVKTADRYVDIDSANGIIRVMSASSPTVLSDYDRYVKLNSDGTIQATGAVSGASVSASGAVSGNSLAATNGITGRRIDVTPPTGNPYKDGNKDGIYLTGVYLSGNVSSYSKQVICAQNATSGSSRKYSELRPDGDIYATDRITGGQVYAGNTNCANGADYAEYFEWIDGNQNGEDRRGRFVTMDGDRVRLATSQDVWLLGVVSGAPSVIGNTAHSYWHDKFLRDEFGTVITAPVEYPAVLDDDGNVIEEAHVEYEPVINPDYDPTREYIPREQRPEWAPVGLVGQIIMLDDGTCEVNGFATSADEGIATKADGVTNYRVIKRIDSNHIMVAAK